MRKNEYKSITLAEEFRDFRVEIYVRRMLAYDMIKNPLWMLDIWIAELPHVMKALEEGII